MHKKLTKTAGAPARAAEGLLQLQGKVLQLLQERAVCLCIYITFMCE